MTNITNYLWLDGETTGLYADKHDIVQLACIPVIAGVEQTVKFNQYCQPINWKAIEPEALRINGLTEEQLTTFQKPDVMVNNLVIYLRQFKTKFMISGYNVDFDRGFIAALFKKVGREKDFLELFDPGTRDVFKKAKKLKSQLGTPNIKLATLCKHFDIPINAHDALSDITATMHLDKVLSGMLGETEIFVTEVRTLEDVSFREPAQLHCHSMFSHTDSLSSIREWVEWCIKNNTPAFSIVDHGNAASLFDIVRLDNVIEEINKDQKTNYDINAVKGIPGTGLIVLWGETTFHLNAWAISEIGYKNLIKLSSLGWNKRWTDSGAEFPSLTLSDLIPLKEGIIFGVPGINGPAASRLVTGDKVTAFEIIEILNNQLDIRLELAAIDAYKYFDSSIGFMSYNVEDGNIQKCINRFYHDVSKKLSIKCIPVSDAHFLDPADKITNDCIMQNSFKDRRYFSESRHQITSREMYSLIKAHIGADIDEVYFNQLIDNTYDIMRDAINLKPKFSYHLPHIAIPDDIKELSDDYNKQCYYLTMKIVKEHGRWNDSPEYKERLKREIDVVMKNSTLNFLPYFLMYEDICRFARSSGLLQNIARGSAGGSLLSYYLKIIHVDPIAANLPFERFLSHARIRAGSFPDIDLDIADRARPLVMQYLKDKYGLGFAQIATFNKMKTKNAIKDSMSALYARNRKDPEVTIICDAIDDSPQGVDEFDFLYGYTDQEGIEHKGEVDKKPILKNFFEQRPEVENMVKKLIGCVRGWSRHASAFVISTIDLSADRVPTMVMSDKDLGVIYVTQYDAPMIEKSGLVKADILGIKTLTMTSDCLALIKKNHDKDYLEEEKGVPLIYRLPDCDSGVFKDFYNKDTDSSFQFNTELIKGYAREFCPVNRADLAAMTALCRPGALDAPLYDTVAAQYYMDVRNGKREVEYLHEDLKLILKDSNGVFVYQEEVMRFLVEIVGYSWEESDMIRSAIAKKKHEVIMATFDRIRQSCKSRGWNDDAIETVCQQIQAFSRYSFNKSHSYAYGELGYITLYLKNHYPLEWWSAVLNNEDKEDKVRKYISYLGEKVAPPSLAHPSNEYIIKDARIIAPLSAIKSVGPSAVNELVNKGPFNSLEDYVSRVDHSKVNIGIMSALIKARAADDFMDDLIEFINYDYIERRKALMDRYVSLRKTKTAFKPEMYDMTPMSVFLDERDYNQSFNKHLLSIPEIRAFIESKWPALDFTSSEAIPYIMRSKSDYDTKILGNVKIAERFLTKSMPLSLDEDEKKKFETDEVGTIMLFQGSEYKEGVSKKSGKPWSKLTISMSDGYSTIEGIRWDAKKALGWPKNTIIYVRGKLKIGWKTPVSITIKEFEKVE